MCDNITCDIIIKNISGEEKFLENRNLAEIDDIIYSFSPLPKEIIIKNIQHTSLNYNWICKTCKRKFVDEDDIQFHREDNPNHKILLLEKWEGQKE